MNQLITNFPEQIIESLSIRPDDYKIRSFEPQNVVVCGLGGSGIGGEIVKIWSRKHIQIPLEVNHEYDLPAYVDQNTLVIVCSYSGNTEETLSALNEAIARKSTIIGISSGGQLSDILNDHGSQVVKVPGGLPPRAALAYPLIQLVGIFCAMNFMPERILDEISASAKSIRERSKTLKAEAENILVKSQQRKIIFYGDGQLKSVMLRACQQINENGKELAFYNVIPEMNHNEIVGWAESKTEFMAVFLRSDLEDVRNAKRLQITRSIVEQKTDCYDIKSNQKDLIHISLEMIHLLDWLSLLIAEQKGADPVEVDVIDYLKSQLAD